MRTGPQQQNNKGYICTGSFFVVHEYLTNENKKLNETSALTRTSFAVGRRRPIETYYTSLERADISASFEYSARSRGALEQLHHPGIHKHSFCL